MASVEAGLEESLCQALSCIWYQFGECFPPCRTERGDNEHSCFKERYSSLFTDRFWQVVSTGWFLNESVLGFYCCNGDKVLSKVNAIFGENCLSHVLHVRHFEARLVTAISYFRAGNLHGHFDFRSRFLCFQTCPLGPLVSLASVPTAKRSKNGYGDENG